MSVFRNRPLALLCCSLAVAALLGWRLSGALKWTLAGVFLLCAVVLLCFFRKFGHSANTACGRLLRSFWLCCLGAAVALCSSAWFFNGDYEVLQRRSGEPCTATGVVLCREDAGYQTTLQVRLEELDGERSSAKALLECAYISALQPGERFTVQGTLRAFETDGDDWEESYRLSEGFVTAIAVANQQDCRWEAEGKTPLLCRFRSLNESLSYRLYRAVGEEYGGLSCALLLGNRSALSGDTVLSFQRAGVSHLLALSGLHVSLLLAFVDGLLRLLRMPKFGRALLLPLCSVGYVLLTGCSLSTIRAVAMMCILYLGFLLAADYDSFTALSVCLAALLLWMPYAVLDLSLWLSFLAAGSIIVFSPLLQQLSDALYRACNWPKPMWAVVRRVLSAVFVGVCANLALMLVGAFSFGTVSLNSVPATFVLVPLVTVLLPLSGVLLLFPRATLLGKCCALLSRWSEKIADRFSRQKGVLLAVDDVYSIAVLVLMTVSLVLCAVLTVRRKGWFLVPVVLSLLCVATSVGVTQLLYDDLAVEYLHENGGDVLLFAEAGKSVAVDFSDGTEAYSVKQAATEHRCTELDDLVLNHYHNKDTVLLTALSERILVRRLRLPVPENDEERAIAKRLEQEAALHGIEVLYHTEGLAIEALAIPVNAHAEPTSGRHEGILFAARVEDVTVTYLNVSVMESALADIAAAFSYDAQILFVGDSGFSKHSVQPIPASGPLLKHLVVADEKLLPLCSSVRSDVVVTVFSERYSFLWERAFSR